MPQPDENYVRGGSCAFDAARIDAYQKANSTFKTDMTQSGEVSLPKLRDLLAMDLAYIHLRSIKWKAKKPAHLGSGGAADDDESLTTLPRIQRVKISRRPLQH